MPGRMLPQAPEAPYSSEHSERSQVGEESGAYGCRLHRGSTTPETWRSKPWRSCQTFLGLAGRGTGEQVLLQVTCCPGLHEDVFVLGPRLGSQLQGALHDVYVAALMAGTPLAPYGIRLLGSVGFLLWVHKKLRPLTARRPKLPLIPTELSGGHLQDPASSAATSVLTHTTLFPS